MTLTPRQIQRYGWRPDTPDNRDLLFRPRRKLTQKVPAKVDLRTSGFMPSIYDQGQLGSCTANSIAAAYEFEQKRQGLMDYQPSRLFIYYGERVLEQSVAYDAGAEIRDGLKVVSHEGAPHETLWPYNIGAFTQKPAAEAYADGLLHKAMTYASVPIRTGNIIEVAIASLTPVIIGFTVYPWFESPDAHGTCIPVKDQQVLGGHSVCIVGYEKIAGSRKVWAIVRNSWGSSWGDQGYCYMPLTWLTDPYNGSDYWTIQSVEA